MTAAALDVRAMPDEALLSLYRSDERAAAAALAEAARRDRTDRAAAARAAIRAEWYDAAYPQFLTAEARLSRGICSTARASPPGVADPFSLWHGRADVAKKYASEELRDLWAISPRSPSPNTTRQRAAAMPPRARRNDTSTEEAGSDEHAMDANRRARTGRDACQPSSTGRRRRNRAAFRRRPSSL